MDIKLLKQYYKGFFIEEPTGNNAFSFDQRENKKIWVAPIIDGSLRDLSIGDKIAFSEVGDGKEINKAGLKSFLYLSVKSKDVFVFDNHNHAFFFWIAGLKQGAIKKGLKLVHVDMHKDTRKPKRSFDQDLKDTNLQKVFEYTNFTLNVGNFIPPALECGVFSEVLTIDSEEAFNQPVEGDFVLDIDMDIFATEMDYISIDLKINKIREYIEASQFITIATSPYFMDQVRAIELIGRLLFNSCKL